MNVLAKFMNSAAAETSHQSVGLSDPMDRLPAGTRAKLIALEDQVAALHGAIPTDRVTAAYERREAIRAERARYAEHVACNGRSPDDAERLAALDKREANATADIKRIESVRDRASDAWNLAGNIFNRCMEHVRGTSAPKAAPVPSVKLDRGQTYLDAVTAVRAELEKLEDERRSVDLAPAPARELA